MKSVFISYTFTINISVHSLVIVIQDFFAAFQLWSHAYKKFFFEAFQLWSHAYKRFCFTAFHL
jgi:hypothetical protein